MKKFVLGYERFCRVVLMIFMVHLATIVHTVMGLVLVGFFPSVSASYATYRTWLLDLDQSWTVKRTWTVFHKAWKEDLKSANLFGWPQLIIGLFLAWDYYLANFNSTGTLGIAASGLLLAVNVVYLLFLVLSWAVRSNYDEKPGWIIKMTFNMVLARPVCTLVLVVVIIATLVVWWRWSGFLAAFGIALPLFVVVMVVSYLGRLKGMDAKELKESRDERMAQ